MGIRFVYLLKCTDVFKSKDLKLFRQAECPVVVYITVLSDWLPCSLILNQKSLMNMYWDTYNDGHDSS